MIKVDTTDAENVTVTYHNIKDCPCCDGKGIQKGTDGIKIICPCCHGTGCRREKQCVPYTPPDDVPYSPPWNPWGDPWYYQPQREKYIITCRS